MTKVAIQKLKLSLKLKLKQRHLETKKELVLRRADRGSLSAPRIVDGWKIKQQKDDFICFLMGVLLRDYLYNASMVLPKSRKLQCKLR